MAGQGPSSGRQPAINTAGGQEWRPAPTQRAGKPGCRVTLLEECAAGGRGGGNRRRECPGPAPVSWSFTLKPAEAGHEASHSSFLKLR